MIDHLVYAAPDLPAVVEELAERLGVAPSPGGKHAGQGTRNYLLSLGGGTYLEIIGPDPEQPPPVGPRPFRLDELSEPLLAAWVVRAPNIEERVAQARARGYDPGTLRSMTRTLPDGKVLAWRLAVRATDAIPSVIPFLIDWGDTPHPSASAAQGARLLTFRGRTSDVEGARQVLDALGVELELAPATSPSLVAVIRGPGGDVAL